MHIKGYMPRPVVLGHDPHCLGTSEDYSDHIVIARHGKHVYDSSLDSWSVKVEFALFGRRIRSAMAILVSGPGECGPVGGLGESVWPDSQRP